MKKLLAGLCALVFLVGSGLALAQEETCSPARVSVGYVDNDGLDGHTGSFFPTPFAPQFPANPGGTCGLPGSNCIFIGTPGPNGDWDAGVIKIDNPLTDPTDPPLVVQNVTVDIGPVTGLDPWATFFPIAIPPGGTLILTEDTNLFNFDTSDIPPEAGPPTCTADTFKPLIHVTVGTSTQLIRNFSDDNRVLNTGGVDKGLCPLGTHTNEGQQYRRAIEQQITCALPSP